jgi:tRNA pseudouridine55 synthase
MNPAANPSGILLLDKPVGESSFQALYPVKRAFGGKKGAKIGHAGTLDPAASGLLVIGVGAGTRLLEFLEGMPKSYRFTLRLGLATDTYDLDGEVLERRDASGVSRGDIEALLPRFRGEILQSPPAYSAVKVDGKRAYARARAGETVTLAPRPVRVDRLEVTAFEPGAQAFAVLELDCSKGTYVRTIAHDLGQLLGCGAVAAGIRRTAIGPFRVEEAVSPDAVIPEAAPAGSLIPALISLERAVSRALDRFPVLEVKESWVAALRNGNPVPPAGYTVPAASAGVAGAREYAVLSPDGALLAIGEVNPLGQLRPRKVFPAA